jgi:hypothetical protein
VNLCRSYSRACCPAGERRLRNVSSLQFGQRGLSSTPNCRGKLPPTSSDITVPPGPIEQCPKHSGNMSTTGQIMPFRRANPIGAWCGLKFFVAYDIYVTPNRHVTDICNSSQSRPTSRQRQSSVLLAQRRSRAAGSAVDKNREAAGIITSPSMKHERTGSAYTRRLPSLSRNTPHTVMALGSFSSFSVKAQSTEPRMNSQGGNKPFGSCHTCHCFKRFCCACLASGGDARFQAWILSRTLRLEF